ncbi:hypothetical protein TNCV_2005861 [Trichonephila clavipes]|nr:hypothetical protein TNCV_2005861 [Trichonephila clavipes]
MLGGAQSEENSLAQSSRDLRVDSGNVDETEVSSGILPEKAQEHIEDSQRNITSCRNERCCAELALAWKYAKEGKGNYYEVDGYLSRRDKILGESIGQLGGSEGRCEEEILVSHVKECQAHSIGGACEEQLPAPGNRSNERRYRERDLAKRRREKLGTGKRGAKKSWGREK